MTQKSLDFKALTLVAARFKLLSDPVRLQILQILKEGECSVSKMAELLSQSQPNISKHLKLLSGGDLVTKRQEGNLVYYAIDDLSIFQICDVVCQGMEKSFSHKASVLKQHN